MKQEGAPGFDIVVTRIIRRTATRRAQRFFTRYKPKPRIIEFGPGATPSPSPGAQGDPRKPRRPGDEEESPEATETPEAGTRR